MVLPVTTLTIGGIGGFFLTARRWWECGRAVHPARSRGKGLGEFRVAVGHAPRNALLPVYTTLTRGSAACRERSLSSPSSPIQGWYATFLA